MLSLQSSAIPIAVSSVAAFGYLLYRIHVHRTLRGACKLLTEVCKERESLRGALEALPHQLESAKLSAIAAVRIGGASAREAAQRRLADIDLDVAETKLLQSQLPAADPEGTDRSGMDLHMQLAEILALSIRANRLAEKYRRAALEPEVFAEEPAEELDAATLFEQAASLPAQARAQPAAMSLATPS